VHFFPRVVEITFRAKMTQPPPIKIVPYAYAFKKLIYKKDVLSSDVRILTLVNPHEEL